MTSARRSFAAILLTLTSLTICAVAGAQSSTTYTSHRYHYSFGVPAGWKVQAATTTIVAPGFPTGSGYETDKFTKGDSEIRIAATQLSASETLSRWTASRVAQIAKQFQCTKPTRRTAHLGGANAIELVYKECFGYFDVFEAVHGGRGYDVYWLGPPPGTAFKTDVSRFHFLP
jgi:hypothetical protein